MGSVTVTGDGGSGSIANELLQREWSATSAVHYIVLRDGAGDQGSALYCYDPAQTSGTWSMEETQNKAGQVGALSTLGAVQVVPVPAALPLLLTALGALGLTAART